MKSLRYLIPIAVLLVIGLITGSFLDLQIDTIIYSKNNIFGLILASIGEHPSYGGLSFIGGMMVAIHKTHTTNKYHLYMTFITGILLYILGSYLTGNEFRNVNGWGSVTNFFNPIYILMPVGLIICAPALIIGITFGKKIQNPKALYILLVMTIMIALGFVFFEIFKQFLHRPRYRFICNSGYDVYHNWWEPFPNYKEYIIDGFTGEEFKSFPSGHTCQAGYLMFILCFLPYFFPKLKNKQTMLFYIGAAWMVLIAFSRMLVGAHYLSDVSVGGLISLLVFLIGDFIIKKMVYKGENPFKGDEVLNE